MLDVTSEFYVEDEVLGRYISGNFAHMMTDFERRTYNLAIMREKAKHGDSPACRLPKWLARETEDVIQASEPGLDIVRRRIKERMLREQQAGKLFINRCPKCDRIVRTPLAKQCLWCGYDWHGT